jgi:hypothetical protein
MAYRGSRGRTCPPGAHQQRGRTYLEYDKPSSLFGQFADDRIAAVASLLDQKLEELVTMAVG